MLHEIATVLGHAVTSLLHWLHAAAGTAQSFGNAGGGHDQVWTFAYGANMGLAKMHLLGIHPFKSLVGLLPHHELIFDRSLADGINEPAFANIRHIEDPTDPAAVSPVHGVVHAISQKELTALDSSEAPLYHRVQMPVQVSTPHGPHEVKAWTYVGDGSSGSAEAGHRTVHSDEGAPSARYAKLVLCGAKERSLPEWYQERLLRSLDNWGVPRMTCEGQQPHAALQHAGAMLPLVASSSTATAIAFLFCEPGLQSCNGAVLPTAAATAQNCKGESKGMCSQFADSVHKHGCMLVADTVQPRFNPASVDEKRLYILHKLTEMRNLHTADIHRISSCGARSHMDSEGTDAVLPEEEGSLAKVRVCVRFRPVLPGEEGPTGRIKWDEGSAPRSVHIQGGRHETQKAFQFDRVFPPSTSQEEVFKDAGLDELLDALMDGYHSTVFAYGQTGSGKTFTMEGFSYQPGTVAKAPQVRAESTSPENLGIVPRAIHGLFDRIDRRATTGESVFTVRLSFLQIYNERIFDLLNPVHLTKFGQGGGLRLRWNPREASVTVENLFVFECRTADEALNHYKAGVKNRTVASHQMNQASSRSHSVLMMTLERRTDHSVDQSSKLTLVDLAGSERQADTGASGRTLQESASINQSLFVLRKVIAALAKHQTRQAHLALIPYRESKLTILLRDALGGSGYTLMVACLSILDSSVEENLSTLQYACTAGKIRNRPVVNLDPTTLLIKQLQQEVQRLKRQLEIFQKYIIHLTGKPIPQQILHGGTFPNADTLDVAPEAARDEWSAPFVASSQHAPPPGPVVGHLGLSSQERKVATPRGKATTPTEREPTERQPPSFPVPEVPLGLPGPGAEPPRSDPSTEAAETLGISKEELAERLSEAVVSLGQATTENFTLRRKCDAAQKANDALELQVSSLEKELLLHRQHASRVGSDASDAWFGDNLAQLTQMDDQSTALTAMRAAAFYDLILLREELSAGRGLAARSSAGLSSIFPSPTVNSSQSADVSRTQTTARRISFVLLGCVLCACFAARGMLRCRAGHIVEKVKKLKPWQGHIHVRECSYCRNEIDRHEVHYSCPEKCRFYVCHYCYKSEVAKRKSSGQVKHGWGESGRQTSGDSINSKASNVCDMISDSGASSAGSSISSPPMPRPALPKLTVPGTSVASADMRSGHSRGSSTGRSQAARLSYKIQSASKEFLESSWQRSVEVVFWVSVVFISDFIGAFYLQNLTTDEELAFPYPFLTACLSNFVAAILVITIVFLLSKTGTQELVGELAAEAEVDMWVQLILGVLITFEVAAAAKVLSNQHHTMAAWFYMLTPVTTVLVASTNYFGMEVLHKELLTAAGVASLGGMMAVHGPWPSLEGLTSLEWACLAVVFTVGRCLLTQKVMSPAQGRRPGALIVSKLVLLAAFTVGVELSLYNEWHGFWSIPWLPRPGPVFRLVAVIGICDACSVIGTTRLIQITSAAFGALLVPFHTVTLLPIESLNSSISVINWLGLVLCVTSAVMYFKARKSTAEHPAGYSTLPSQLAAANAPLLKALQKLRVAWGPTPQDMSRAAFRTLGPEDEEEDDPRKHDCKGRLDQREAVFNFKQQKLQTDMEMWFMEAVPEIYGASDSDDLDESLQEDAQAEIIAKICSTGDCEAMRQTLLDWLVQCPDPHRRDDFVGKAVSMALKVNMAGRSQK
ncbi:kif4 [Symbiodinium microadriaticum]|nr:kif4 [Symbiodinium sp. KB8]CAE7684247.1 kif4 [Symbiodinium microadriaticum]